MTNVSFNVKKIKQHLFLTVLCVFVSHLPLVYASPIEAYLSSFSVAQGESVDIHASTNDPSFSIEVYKDGSDGYQRLTEITGVPGNFYTTPAEGWLGANWPAAHTLTVPLSWQSGLYRIRLLTSDAYTDLGIVVKENAPGTVSDILVVDSAPTWVAYNNWGGKSLYTGDSTDLQAATSLSLQRPNQHTLRSELLELNKWLEHEAIAAEYASMFDLHHNPTLLTDYNVVILVGHSEYWSREMRDHFDNFIATGGNAIILSGNTMWWQIRIEGDLLVCYKTDYENDPLYTIDNPRVTSNWFNAPVDDPENRSIGVSWRNGGFVNYSGYFTPEEGHGGYTTVNTNHWIYHGTHLSDGQILGYDHSIVGYEVDGAEVTWVDNKPVVTGNDGTPLGFIVLGYAPTHPGITPPNQTLGTMGIFQAPNGGGYVFNAATIDWADGLWSLSNNKIADYHVSQITYNLINAFSSVFFPLRITTPALPNLLVNSPFSSVLRRSGGDAPYSWSITGGNLPAGLTLNSSTGEIQGSATSIGTSTFEVTVTDYAGANHRQTYTMEVGNGLVYEDAEDGTIFGWSTYDATPAGASISNVFDTSKNSSVIELTGTGTDNGFVLRQNDGSDWQNTQQTQIEWSMRFNSWYTIYIDIETSAGHRYLQYNASNSDYLGSGEYVHHGLGASSTTGVWQTFSRDLQADLQDAQPGVVLREVNGFLIRGNGRVDDIQLLNSSPPLQIHTSTLADALVSNPYSQFIQVSGGQMPYSWSISNASLPTGLFLNSTTGEISGTATDTGNSTFEVTVTGASGNNTSATLSIAVVNESVYEDGEDGSVLGWSIYDTSPSGATLNNVFDAQRNSQVIEIAGTGVNNGFVLRQSDGSDWQNNTQTVLEWSMQFSSLYTLYIDVETSAGHRYLQYSASDYDALGSGEYIRFALGSASINGQWQTFRRDLQADLQLAQPGVILQQVNGFLVRGSGRLDDIKLLNDTPELRIETATLPGALLGDSYSQLIQVSGGSAPYNWSATSGSLPAGLLLNSNTGELSGTATAAGSFSFIVTVSDISASSVDTAFSIDIVNGLVYEDAEDGNVLGWTIYDANPTGASINNVFDTSKNSQVIELMGTGTSNGFVLRQADGSSWQNNEQIYLKWSMRYSELFTIYVDVQTNAGHRYLQYTASNTHLLGDGEYIIHGLGESSTNGQWQTFTRNLQADLNEAQPDTVLLEVNGFLIRGSGKVDDIELLSVPSLSITTTEIGDILLNDFYSQFIEVSGGQNPLQWSISSGILPTGLNLNNTTGEISGTTTDAGSFSFVVTVTDATGTSVDANYTANVQNRVSYEDAEDGNVLGWDIYDTTPAGASINNVFDTVKNSRVIELLSTGVDNGFRLRSADGSGWGNNTSFTLTWAMQFSGLYTVYVDLETTAGHRYLQYTASDSSNLGSGEYVHHGLGQSSMNGLWQSFSRDLQADLQQAQPGVVIVEVNGFLIRGSGKLDDISLQP